MATAVEASDIVHNRQLGLLTDATNVLHQRRSLLPPDSQSVVDKVKRCLFGVPDHRLIADDLNAIRRQLDAQSRQRWNFDFRYGAPLASVAVSNVATSEAHLGVRWVWSRVSQSLVRRHRQSVTDFPPADINRRLSLTEQSHRVSPSPRRHLLLDRPNPTAVKRRRMSLTPSVEVKGKVAGSEVKAVSCRRSVGGLERRRSLRSTSLLGCSPSRMHC